MARGKQKTSSLQHQGSSTTMALLSKQFPSTAVIVKVDTQQRESKTGRNGALRGLTHTYTLEVRT
eukprot:1159117-Pelagomonas_calceolata.AAC.8